MKITDKAKRGFIYTLFVGLMIALICGIVGQWADAFVLKRDLLSDYATKTDIEKQYCSKVEIAISRNDYEHLANDVYEIKKDIKTLVRYLNLESAQNNCPYPPCPGNGKKKTTDVADNK